jgi:hypothetical protein
VGPSSGQIGAKSRKQHVFFFSTHGNKRVKV